MDSFQSGILYASVYQRLPTTDLPGFATTPIDRYHSRGMLNWFGPSREEVWRQLSEAIGARFVDGGFFKSDKVEAVHEPCVVTLENYAVSTGKATIVFTRMRAPYVNPDGFRFTIYRNGLFSELGRDGWGCRTSM